MDIFCKIVKIYISACRLTRLHKTLVEDRSAQVNRVGKILELANVKLASVVSDIMGVTGRRIRRSWPTWRAGACAESAGNSPKWFPASSGTTTGSCCGGILS